MLTVTRRGGIADHGEAEERNQQQVDLDAKRSTPQQRIARLVEAHASLAVVKALRLMAAMASAPKKKMLHPAQSGYDASRGNLPSMNIEMIAN